MKDERVELETKLAFQEDLVHALNRTVAEQQQELVELRRDLEELRKQLRALEPNLTSAALDETPPHY